MIIGLILTLIKIQMLPKEADKIDYYLIIFLYTGIITLMMGLIGLAIGFTFG